MRRPVVVIVVSAVGFADLGRQRRGGTGLAVVGVAQGQRVDQGLLARRGAFNLTQGVVHVAQRLGHATAVMVVDVGAKLPGHAPGAHRAAGVLRQRCLERAHGLFLIEGIGLQQTRVEQPLRFGRAGGDGQRDLAKTAKRGRTGRQVGVEPQCRTCDQQCRDPDGKRAACSEVSCHVGVIAEVAVARSRFRVRHGSYFTPIRTRHSAEVSTGN